MRLFGETNHTFIAVGVVMGALSLGIFSTVMSTRTPNKPASTEAKVDRTAVAGLTAGDLRGTVKMTGAQRQRSTSICTARVATLDMRGRGGPVRIEGSIAEFTARRQPEMTRICDCLIEQMENRANGLQFAMFLSALDGRRGGPIAAMPNYRQYWDFATSHGVSDKDFRELTTELASFMVVSGENCAVILEQ